MMLTFVMEWHESVGTGSTLALTADLCLYGGGNLTDGSLKRGQRGDRARGGGGPLNSNYRTACS